MLEDAAKAITIIISASPWLLVIALLAFGWWNERKERLSLQSDYKALDRDINIALNQIALFMEIIKDRIK